METPKVEATFRSFVRSAHTADDVVESSLVLSDGTPVQEPCHGDGKGKGRGRGSDFP